MTQHTRCLNTELHPAPAPAGSEIIRTDKFHNCLRVPFVLVQPTHIEYAYRIYSRVAEIRESQRTWILYSPLFEKFPE